MRQMTSQSFEQLHLSLDPLEFLAIAIRRQKFRFLFLQSVNILFDCVNRVHILLRLVIGNSLGFGDGLDEIVFVHA